MHTRKIISLNIEGEAHLENVQQFITAQNADIVCLQEATSVMVSFLESRGYIVSFAPMTIKTLGGVDKEWGVLIAHRHTFTSETLFYKKSTPHPTTYIHEQKNDTISQLILVSRFEADTVPWTIATTHFTWTQHGEKPSEHQYTDLDAFLNIVEKLEPHIICGDFNIPRHHSPLYEKLHARYTDNIPLHYATSIDKDLHRLRTNPEKQHVINSFMVDYLFTTPEYDAHTVSLEFGISDHAAVVGHISHKQS